MTPEQREQVRVKKLYEAAGGVVYDLSQPRATKQTPGLPDLWIFLPRAACGLWHETKTPAGRASPAQREFAEHCRRSGVPYTIGGHDAALTTLKTLGVVVD